MPGPKTPASSSAITSPALGALDKSHRSRLSTVDLLPYSLFPIPCFYDAIPSPTRFAAAIIISIPAQSSLTGRPLIPAHSPSARPIIPAKRT